MKNRYRIVRLRAAIARARRASAAESRRIRDELADAAGVEAAIALPFMLPRTAPATVGERAVLRLPHSRPWSPETGDRARRDPPLGRGGEAS